MRAREFEDLVKTFQELDPRKPGPKANFRRFTGDLLEAADPIFRLLGIPANHRPFGGEEPKLLHSHLGAHSDNFVELVGFRQSLGHDHRILGFVGFLNLLFDDGAPPVQSAAPNGDPVVGQNGHLVSGSEAQNLAKLVDLLRRKFDDFFLGF